MDLFDKVHTVTDRNSFINFLSALQNDFVNNPDNWENQKIDTFLDAIQGWLIDYNGSDVDFETPDWKTIAAIFYMGKIYE
ncbi:MAG: hypothetical protein LBU77_00095 [Clostridiales bacterium]|jgi:hypothetical protein|nr:hypothetical protein [Clostridiales bacterium]